MPSSYEIAQTFAQQNQMFMGQGQYAQTLGPSMRLQNQVGMGGMGVGAYGFGFGGGPRPLGFNFGQTPLAGYGPGNAIASGMMSGANTIASGSSLLLGGAALLGIGGGPVGLAATAAAGGAMAIGGMAAGGAQQAQINTMLGSQYQFFNQASRTGQGFTRDDAKAIGDSIRQLSHIPALMTNVEELTKIASRLKSTGVMQGVRSAADFQARFKEALTTIRESAKILGTTMEEAEQFFAVSRGAGFYGRTAQLKNALNVQFTSGVTGATVGQVSNLQQQGADMAMQFGARRQLGAQAVTRIAQNIGLAQAEGRIKQEQIEDVTGLQGAEAQMAMSQRLFSGMLRFGQTAPGRLAMAGMMRYEGGKAVGVDEELARRFRSGLVSVDELRSRAGRLSDREKISFQNRQEDLIASLAGQLGPGGAFGMMKSVIGDRYGGNEETTNLIMRRYTGMSAGEIDVMGGMQGVSGEGQSAMMAKIRQRIASQRERTDPRAIFQRFKTKVHSATIGKLEQAGAALQNSIAKEIDSFVDDVFGREITTLTEERIRGLAAAFSGESSSEGRAMLESITRLKGKPAGATAAPSMQSMDRLKNAGAAPPAGSPQMQNLSDLKTVAPIGTGGEVPTGFGQRGGIGALGYLKYMGAGALTGAAIGGGIGLAGLGVAAIPGAIAGGLVGAGHGLAAALTSTALTSMRGGETGRGAMAEGGADAQNAALQKMFGSEQAERQMSIAAKVQKQAAEGKLAGGGEAVGAIVREKLRDEEISVKTATEKMQAITGSLETAVQKAVNKLPTGMKKPQIIAQMNREVFENVVASSSDLSDAEKDLLRSFREASNNRVGVGSESMSTYTQMAAASGMADEVANLAGRGIKSQQSLTQAVVASGNELTALIGETAKGYVAEGASKAKAFEASMRSGAIKTAMAKGNLGEAKYLLASEGIKMSDADVASLKQAVDDADKKGATPEKIGEALKKFSEASSDKATAEYLQQMQSAGADVMNAATGEAAEEQKEVGKAMAEFGRTGDVGPLGEKLQGYGKKLAGITDKKKREEAVEAGGVVAQQALYLEEQTQKISKAGGKFKSYKQLSEIYGVGETELVSRGIKEGEKLTQSQLEELAKTGGLKRGQLAAQGVSEQDKKPKTEAQQLQETLTKLSGNQEKIANLLATISGDKDLLSKVQKPTTENANAAPNGTANPAATAQTSDARLKKNIWRSSYEIIPGVPVASWEWITPRNEPTVGVIAQDLQKVRPDLVVQRVDGTLAVNYEGLIAAVA